MAYVKKVAIHYNGQSKPWLEIGFEHLRPFWTKYVNYYNDFIKKCQKEKELLEAMLMISIAQNEKSELSKAIEEDNDKQVLKLRGDYDEQIKRNNHANEANLKLEADLMNLLMELEGIKVAKEKLNQETKESKWFNFSNELISRDEGLHCDFALVELIEELRSPIWIEIQYCKNPRISDLGKRILIDGVVKKKKKKN